MPRTSELENLLYELIATGQAVTRADLARSTGAAPSTISGAVTKMLYSGRIVENGVASSTGGRRATLLQASHSRRRFLVAELGVRHIRLGLAERTGDVTYTETWNTDISSGAEASIQKLHAYVMKLTEQQDAQLSGVGIAVPGPVDAHRGIVVGPSRMPGWNGAHVGELIAKYFHLPSIVDNDARLGALGEYAYRLHKRPSEPALRDFIYVKAGSAIGGAFVTGGDVFTGSRGLAGDISHVPVPAGESHPCQCGNIGCLETVASADAVRATLREQGQHFTNNGELLRAALDGEASVVTAIRSAGVQVGESLAHNVSFLAPGAVIIGGTLSAVDAFTAGVRQSLHELCLHDVMEGLSIQRSHSGMDAALWGLAHRWVLTQHALE